MMALPFASSEILRSANEAATTPEWRRSILLALAALTRSKSVISVAPEAAPSTNSSWPPPPVRVSLAEATMRSLPLVPAIRELSAPVIGVAWLEPEP